MITELAGNKTVSNLASSETPKRRSISEYRKKSIEDTREIEKRFTTDLVASYQIDLKDYKRVDSEQELWLARRIKKYKEIKENKDFPGRSEKTITTATARFLKYRNQLAMANIGLVFKWARPYRHSETMPYIDTIAEGHFGLLTAAEDFDYKRGAAFSNFASTQIRKAIYRAFANQSREIRLPEYMHFTLRILERWNQESLARNGRELTDDEVRERLHTAKSKQISGLKIEDIKAAQKANQTVLLSAPRGGQDGVENSVIADTLESPVNVENTATRAGAVYQLKQELVDVLKALCSPRDKCIFLHRVGMFDGRVWTGPEIKTKFKITKQRVDQIQKIIYTKLRSSEEIQERLMNYR